MQLREQLFEQEKLLQSQNEWLNTELNSKSGILLKLGEGSQRTDTESAQLPHTGML